MFHLTVLASGSSGNCSLVETPTTRILLDAGVNAKQIALRLERVGVAPSQINAIVLTHEHSDHAAGVGVWARRHGTPVYANRLTAEALKEATKGAEWRIFPTGAGFEIGDIQLQSFAIPHDAAEPVGFVLNHRGIGLGFLTDLGVVTRLAFERVKAVHTLLIETNHDEKMLQDDQRRPWSVKQRILSKHGHLSNRAAAEALGEIVGGNLRRAVLGHLSSDCNSPDLAVQTVRNHLAMNGGGAVDVVCVHPSEGSARMAVG